MRRLIKLLSPLILTMLFLSCIQSVEQDGSITFNAGEAVSRAVQFSRNRNEKDEKIIAVPVNDPSMATYSDISELPGHMFEEISHFFEVYKVLEHKHTTIQKIAGRDDALQCIQHCIESYQLKFETK